MQELAIQENLTPENAQEQGYQWFADKIYDLAAPAEANQSMHEWVKQGGIIGQAVNPDFNDYAIGLYERIDNQNNPISQNS